MRALGVILTLVNGLGIVLFPLNYFLSSGDTAFMAYYLHVHEAWVAVPYELLRGAALVAALVGLGSWHRQRRWAIPALYGYFLTMLVLFPLDKAVRTGVAQENPFFAPVAGWSAPVLILHTVALGSFMLAWRRLRINYANCLSGDDETEIRSGNRL